MISAPPLFIKRWGHIILSGVLTEEQLHIVLDRADACNAEVLNENLCHIGAEEGGQSGTQVDILHAQVQQGQQHDDRLLLIPGDVVDNRQVVDVVQAEDLLQLQGNDSQGVGVVALTGIQYTGNAADVTQRQLVVLVLGAAGGEDDRVLGQGLGKLGVVVPALGPGRPRPPSPRTS